MADGLVIKHPQTGAVIFNTATITSHSRATFNTNGAAGSVSVADLLRGEPYIIQALPTDPGQEYGITDFTISGSTISWQNAARSMRVVAGSYAIGGPAGSKTFDGFMVRRPGGALQISTADFALQLASYGSLILTDDGGTHPQPMVTGSVTVSGNSPVMAFRGEDGAEISLRSVSRSGSQFTFHFACRASSPTGLIYWIFDTTQQGLALNTDAALVLKDGTGVKTFDSRVYAMNVLTTREASTQGGASTVSPSAGQSLAVIQSTSGWRQTMYDLGAYSSQEQRPDTGSAIGDGSGGRGPTTRWAYMKLESYHATARFEGSSVVVGMQRFEDFEDWYPVGQQPTDGRWGQARHTIINVAGLPSAAMPNPSDIAVSVSAAVREVSTQSAGSANTISPASVANASGGTAPYSYLWQYVSGSTLIAAYDFTSSASFRTQSLNQPAGETRETVWRCRVTDAAGRVGYSQPVTFRHVVERVDYIPDPINFQDANTSVGGEVSAVITNYQPFNGITHPIRLKFVISYTGNLTAGSFKVHSSTRNTFIVDVSLTTSEVEVVVNPGEQICIYCDGSTTSGLRTGSWNVEVRNEFTAGGVLDSVSLNLTVDNDNNYNVVDYIPDNISVSNQSVTSNSHSVRTDPGYFQITGTTHTITLRFTRSNNAGSAYTKRQFIYSGPTQNGPWTEHFMGINSAPLDISAAPGTWFYVQGLFETQSGRGDGSWNMTISNEFANGGIIASWSVSGVVDNDNNYNVPDYTPDAISLTNLAVTTNASSGSTNASIFQITGTNQNITLRISRTTPTGNDTVKMQIVGVGDTFSGPWTTYNFQGSDTYTDIEVAPGKYVILQAYGETTSGRRTSTWTTTVRNQSDGGAVLGSLGVNIIVDNDNNYNVADYSLTPGAISFSNKTVNANGPDASASFGGGYANGINQNITLRAVASPIYRGGAVASYFTVTVGGVSRSWDIGVTTARSWSFTVSPGQYVSASASLGMFAGSGDAWVYWHVDLFNDSDGGKLVSGFDGGLTTIR